MEFGNIFKKCTASLVAASTGFFICVALCTSTFLQRQIFYAHRAPIWLGQKLDKPESFGFLHNQVLPIHISTSDRQTLYAWLVTPLVLYAKHERELVQSSQGGEGHRDTAIRLLQDPESRLVIYFHGTAGTIGQTRRTDAYRMVSSGASEKIHVLAFDYRGFGHSTGSPTESGLIEDALSVIKWATTTGKVSTTRIVLLAQSLGTAVATAAADALVRNDPTTEFAGIMLCAAFTDAPSVFTSYKVGGKVPVLAPLKAFASLNTWFGRRVRDKWDTRRRVCRLIQGSKRIRITLFAAQNDEVIPFRHTDILFNCMLRKVLGNIGTDDQFDNECQHLDLNEGGTVMQWQEGDKFLKKVIVHYGGHNGIMKWAPVAIEVFKSFYVS